MLNPGHVSLRGKQDEPFVLALVVLGSVIGMALPAWASTNPSPVNLSYNFDTTLNGVTTFTVYGDGRVTFDLFGQPSPLR